MVFRNFRKRLLKSLTLQRKRARIEYHLDDDEDFINNNSDVDAAPADIASAAVIVDPLEVKEHFANYNSDISVVAATVSSAAVFFDVHSLEVNEVNVNNNSDVDVAAVTSAVVIVDHAYDDCSEDVNSCCNEEEDNANDSDYSDSHNDGDASSDGDTSDSDYDDDDNEDGSAKKVGYVGGASANFHNKEAGEFNHIVDADDESEEKATTDRPVVIPKIATRNKNMYIKGEEMYKEEMEKIGMQLDLKRWIGGKFQVFVCHIIIIIIINILQCIMHIFMHTFCIQVQSDKNSKQIVDRFSTFCAFVLREGLEVSDINSVVKYVIDSYTVLDFYCEFLIKEDYKPSKFYIDCYPLFSNNFSYDIQRQFAITYTIS